MAEPTTPTDYDKALAAIARLVVHLNDTLGLSGDYIARVGYIGNVDANGANDCRAWSVFLPHPGRVGGDSDRIGNWATGDLDGARSCIGALVGALDLARWHATGAHTDAVRIARDAAREARRATLAAL